MYLELQLNYGTLKKLLIQKMQGDKKIGTLN